MPPTTAARQRTTSFSEEVRVELLERPPQRRCCQAAFLSALLRQSGVLEIGAGGELAVRAELAEPAAARTAFSLLRRLGGESDILSYREQRFARRTRVVLRLHGAGSLQLLHEIGVLSAGLLPLDEPPRRLLARRCCRGAYLRAALVAGGSVAAPRRPAHVELRCADASGARVLARIAARDGIALRVAARRTHAIAYSKRVETVRELLAHVGAHAAALGFVEGEAIAQTRARANRITNCDRANLGRTSAAAHAQLEAIRGLDLEALPEPLRRLAELRLAHPDLSLAELGQLSQPPLGKSAVARRMRSLTAS
jgi:cell division protein WhiA